MAINSPIQNYVTSLLAGKALAPSAPAISAPTPFSDDERMDIGYQKFGSRTVTTNPASSSQATAASTRESNNEPRGYSGPFEVSRIYRPEGAIVPEQELFDKALGSKPTIDPVTGRVSYGVPKAFGLFPGGIGVFSQIGGALNNANLERIYEKIQAGEEGYGLAMLNGRVVGVSPGPMSGSTVLSGVLPQGLTTQQRYQLGQNILSVGAPSDEPAPPTVSFDERMAQYTASGEAPDGSSPLLSGGNMNIVQDTAGRPVTSGDSFVTTSAGKYVDPALLAAQADSMRAASQQAEANQQAKAAPTNQGSERENRESDQRSSPRESPYGRGGGPGYGGGRAAGGTVGFAEGGTAKKDPIQSTGFVDGPPQAYAKGTTVADTENHRVRVGSFVINAPTTERLQKEGKLPKGPQKMKAAKGGKMMEVALSKGEYVIDVDDIGKFGGYDALNKENNKGKPEVERRQAAAQGGFLGGYSNGGNITLPTPSPVRQRTAQKEEDISLPNVPDSFRKKLIQFMKPIVDADKKPNRTQINNFIKNLDPKEQLAFLFLTETVSNSAPMVEMENLGEVVFNRVDSNHRDFSKLTNQEQVLLQHVDNNPKKSKQFTGLEPSTVFARAKEVVGGLAEPGLRKAYAASENVHSDDPDRASLRRLPYATVFYTKKDAPNQWMRNSKDLEYAGEIGGHEYYRPISISVEGAREAAQKYRYTNINPEFP